MEEEFVYRVRRPAEAMDPAVKRIVIGAGAASALVIVVALLWSGVRGAGFGPPPVIMPPAAPLREAPADPGGLMVPEANVQIMSGDAESAPAGLAPAPAAPDVTQLNQAAGFSPPAPAALAPALAVPAPATAVQLAASADEPGALAVWNTLVQKYPTLFAGKKAQIVPAVVGGQSVWRLRVGGFGGQSEAAAFCAALAAKGAACTVAAF